jgi:hypothetical protein
MTRALAALALVALLTGCDTGDTTTVTTTLTSPTPIYPTGTSTPCAAVGCTATCPNPALGCTGGGGVGLRAPEIMSFGADNPRITKGGAAVLRWDVSDINALVRIDPGIGSVGTVGFVLVSPTQTTTYTLTARNSLGTVQRQFTVIVFNPE